MVRKCQLPQLLMHYKNPIINGRVYNQIKQAHQSEKMPSILHKICVLALFFALATSNMIIQSDMVGQYIDNGTAIPLMLTSFAKIFPEPGAIAIWGPNRYNVTLGQTLTFVEKFKVQCNNTLTLFVIADDSYIAYINGRQVLRAAQIQLKQTVLNFNDLNITLRQQNQLRIVAADTVGGFAGLSYQMVQDPCAPACRASREQIATENKLLSIDPDYPLSIAWSKHASTVNLNSESLTPNFAQGATINSLNPNSALGATINFLSPNNNFDETNRYEYEQQNRIHIRYDPFSTNISITYIYDRIKNIPAIPSKQINALIYSWGTTSYSGTDDGGARYRIWENGEAEGFIDRNCGDFSANHGVYDFRGNYLVALQCYCPNFNSILTSCDVSLFRIKNLYFRNQLLLTLPASLIKDSTFIKVLKISTNSDTLALVTRDSNNLSVTTLQIFRLDIVNQTNPSRKIAQITRSFQQSLSYFALTTSDQWQTSIIYATTQGPNNDQVVLRKISPWGANTLFNNNLSPEIKISGLRLYASGNGKYIGLLWKSRQHEIKFQMHRVDQYNRIGLGPVVEPEFSFDQIGEISSLEISQHGDRISYVKLGVTKNVFVGLCHSVGQVEFVAACYDQKYRRMYPQLCVQNTTIQNATANQTIYPVEQKSEGQSDNKSSFQPQFLDGETLKKLVLSNLIITLIIIISIITLLIFLIIGYKKWKLGIQFTASVLAKNKPIQNHKLIEGDQHTRENLDHLERSINDNISIEQDQREKMSEMKADLPVKVGK